MTEATNPNTVRKDSAITGAVVFPCKIGGLAIIRSLGRKGIPVVAVDSGNSSLGWNSRFCTRKVYLDHETDSDEAIVRALVNLGKSLSGRHLFYPTSDRVLLIVSKYRDELLPYFEMVISDHELLERVVGKRGMSEVAQEHGMPSPGTCFPKNVDDVVEFSRTTTYPCLLKAQFTYSPLYREGMSMVRVAGPDELVDQYRTMAALDSEIMIQEYIPGEDDQVYLYAGYFDRQGVPVATFTGRKLRQTPIDFGAGSLCECRSYPDLEQLVTSFLKSVNYRGLVDIGLKWDARDRTYKMLDVNPRIGQNFRTFVTAEKRIDLAEMAYGDVSGSPVVETVAREGRRWIIEDADARSSLAYWRGGRLSFRQWLSSLFRVEECAILDLRDPYPFIARVLRLCRTGVRKTVSRATG